MKIISGSEIYVQERDLELLLRLTKKEEIPREVLSNMGEVVRTGKTTAPKQYRVFSGEKAVEFLNAQSFILDHDKLKAMSWTEAINFGAEVLKKLNKAFKAQKGITEATSEEEKELINRNLEILRHQSATVKECVEEKKGYVNVSSTLKTNRKNPILELIRPKRK